MPRTSSSGLSVERLRELARAGAELALQRLRGEIASIERAFPELGTVTRRRPLDAPTSGAKVKRRRRRMSAASRKAVSARMKRYWADRRKLKVKPES
jgi:hypothetical protein